MKNKLLEKFLQEHHIQYQLYNHPPLLTMEDSYKYTNDIVGEHCKNLFVQDKKKENFYHILTKGQKSVDLKQIQQTIGSTRLSFPSPQHLFELLQCDPGCVNPLTMFQTDNNVQYYFDEELKACEQLIFCPSVVDQSVTLTWGEFNKFIAASGKTVHFIKM